MSTEIENDHKRQREKIEEKIRSTPIRSVPLVGAPSSSQVIQGNKEWYQAFAKLSVFALIAVSVCAAAISIALAFVVSKPPETLSYLMDEDGRIVKLESIRNPSLTETEVLNWAAKKILDIHSLTFTDYLDHIYSLRADFSEKAFLEYQRSLLSSKSLKKVKDDRLVMWAEPKEAPKIISAKEVNGKFTWVVEMKITQFLAGGEYASSGSEMMSTIVIERTSRARNLSGVVINKYLAKEIGL